MVNWTEVERVKRGGEDMVENVDGHVMVKIYRLRNGNRIKENRMNISVDESIPDEEVEYKTAWKCDSCGVEVSGVPRNVSTSCR